MTTIGGTPDYNTSVLQDTRILVSQTFNIITGTSTAVGTFYVQQNSHLFVNCVPAGTSANRVLLTFEYFADSALSKLIDTVSYAFTANKVFKQVIPCFGAYVRVTLTTTHAVAIACPITINVDSRPEAGILFNRGREIGPLFPVSVAGGANTTIDLTPTIGGPGMLYWEYTGTNYAFSIWTIDYGANTRFLVHVGNATAPASRWLRLVFPPGQMQLFLQNSDAGAQSFHVVMVLE